MSTHRAASRDDLARAHWRKSAYSGSSGNCVEVADLPTHRAVRDTKNRTGGMLVFTAGEWAAFTAGVRAGEFD